ncbi:hypothetical protein XENOCAPTIV_003625, partial [Xenoophorus captivus]
CEILDAKLEETTIMLHLILPVCSQWQPVLLPMYYFHRLRYLTAQGDCTSLLNGVHASILGIHIMDKQQVDFTLLTHLIFISTSKNVIRKYTSCLIFLLTFGLRDNKQLCRGPLFPNHKCYISRLLRCGHGEDQAVLATLGSHLVHLILLQGARTKPPDPLTHFCMAQLAHKHSVLSRCHC